MLVVNALLTIFILFRSKGNKTRISLFLLIVSISIWLVTNSQVDSASSYHTALLWSRLTLVGPIYIPLCLLIFSLLLTRNNPGVKRILLLAIPAVILTVLVPFPLFIRGVSLENWGVNFQYGPIYTLFAAYFFLYALASFWILLKKYRNSLGTQREQIKFVFLGLIISAFITSATNIFFPLLGVQQLYVIGPPSVIFFLSLTTYAIVRHRLLDIRLVILRTITYSFVVLIISATIVGVTLLLPEAIGFDFKTKTFTAIAVSMFIVLMLDPLKRSIAKYTDKVFFKAKVDYRVLLSEVSDVINHEIDLDILLHSLSVKLEHGLKVKNVSVYLSGGSSGAFHKRKGKVGAEIGKITNDSETVPIEERIARTNPLIQYLRNSKDVIVLEALERKIEDTQDEAARKSLESSKEALDKLDAAVIAPIVVGKNINAVMVLGSKLSGDNYGTEDINLLTLIGPQLASALEKSRLYDEAKQFGERLKKEIAIATQDLRNVNVQLQERNRFLNALQNVTNLITRTLDFKKVTQAIADSIATELGHIGGIVLFLGKDKHKLFPDAVTHSRLTDEVLKLLPKPFSEYWGDFRTSNSKSVQAMKQGQEKIGATLYEFLTPALPQAICDKIQHVLGVKTVIAVPIFSEEGIVGVIDFLLAKEPTAVKDIELNAMKALANQTGIVYRNIELYQQLELSNKELGEANKHLQQLDQAKSEFVSIASHQLRTPMTGIMGYLSMILQGDFGKVPGELGKILTGLLDESQRMIRLINLFLNVTKIESGRLSLNRQQIHLEEIFERVVGMVKKAAEDKKLKMVYEKPAKPLPAIFADADKLNDVVFNLTDNAIKYTEQGSVMVSAKVDGGHILISVKDTGRGIEPGEVNKLFAKFVRGFGIAQVNPDGSGLGLYVARRLTEAHGGDIWVESKGLGKGSTFFVKLPISANTPAEK